MSDSGYSMRELERLSGVTARTLRQWIKLQLLPSPRGVGRAARYDERHVVRAQLVLSLRAKRESLRDIRRQLSGLSETQAAAMLPPKPRATDASGVPVAPPAPSYPASQFDLVPLMEGLFLLVNTGLGPLPRRVADAIYRHYAMPVAG